MTQRVALSVLGLLVVVIWLVWFVTNRCEFETTPIRNDDEAPGMRQDTTPSQAYSDALDALAEAAKDNPQ